MNCKHCNKPITHNGRYCGCTYPPKEERRMIDWNLVNEKKAGYIRNIISSLEKIAERKELEEEMCQCGQLPAWDDNSVCCKEEEE